MAVRPFKMKMKNGALCNVNPNKEQPEAFQPDKSVGRQLAFVSLFFTRRRRVDFEFSQIASTANCC